MSRTTNKFSLFDFCKKQAGKMEIYGEVTLDEDGNIIPAPIVFYSDKFKYNSDGSISPRVRGSLASDEDTFGTLTEDEGKRIFDELVGG